MFTKKCCNCKQRKPRDEVVWPVTTGLACRKCAKFLGVAISGRVPNVSAANSKKWRDKENENCTHRGREYREDITIRGKRYSQGRCRDCGVVSWGPVKA